MYHLSFHGCQLSLYPRHKQPCEPSGEVLHAEELGIAGLEVRVGQEELLQEEISTTEPWTAVQA